MSRGVVFKKIGSSLKNAITGFFKKRSVRVITLVILCGVLITSLISSIIYRAFENYNPENQSSDKLSFLPAIVPRNDDLFKFEGFIVQFRETPLSVRKAEFEKLGETGTSEFANYEKRFNAEFNLHKERIKRMIPDFDKKIRHEFKNVFNGLSLQDVSHEEVKKIEQLTFVKSVYPNYNVKAYLQDSIPLIGADDAWNMGFTGLGVKIAIIDTGIDYSHPDLGGCFGTGCKVIGGYDFYNRDADPMDDHGHGTHVAGIAAANGVLKGVAPDAELLAYKVLNKNGSGYFDVVITAINEATYTGADVINLSLGGYGAPDDPISTAVDNAVIAGTIVSVSAGNYGDYGYYSVITSPASARKAITVGASTKEDTIASFSSRGPVRWDDKISIKPDVVAPGFNICSSQWNDYNNDKLCLDNEHTALSGTSMATPHVAGSAALLKQKNSDWTPEEIKMTLRNTATQIKDENNKKYDIFTQGYGRINVGSAIELTASPPVAELLDNPNHFDANSTMNVLGVAKGDNFQKYELYYSKEHNNQPTDWHLICQSTDPVLEKATLCSFDTSQLLEERYFLKLEVKNTTGQVSTDITPLKYYFPIRSWKELNDIRYNSFGEYLLEKNLSNNDPDYQEFNGGEKGWAPIAGFEMNNDGHLEQRDLPFYGILDGQNYVISDLRIERPAEWAVGLFGEALYPATLKDIGLERVNVNGNEMVGGLIGASASGGIFSSGARITNVYSTGTIMGNKCVGGIVGRFYQTPLITEGTTNIVGSHSTATVTNKDSQPWLGGYFGGLVGESWGCYITDSYSTGNVNGSRIVGGLVGFSFQFSTIFNSYTTSNVFGFGDSVGGLVGDHEYYAKIHNSYSIGSVSGDYSVGGLIGTSRDQVTITNSYSTGRVTSNGSAGGLIGYGYQGTITSSYWNTQTSGRSNSAGGEGRTTAQMTDNPYDGNTYVNWDFNSIWEPYTNKVKDHQNNTGYPALRAEQEPPIIEQYVILNNWRGVDSNGDQSTRLLHLKAYDLSGNPLADTDFNQGTTIVGKGSPYILPNQSNGQPFIQDNIYKICLWAMGYLAQCKNITMPEDNKTGVDFELTPGDAVTDNVVNLFDMNAIMINFATSATVEDPRDIDGDGLIGLTDLNTIFLNFTVTGDS